MDGANADSDHSMSWEDFFGSTTDLTPTLIGIFDSLQSTNKSEVSRFDLTAKDARNDPPEHKTEVKAKTMSEDIKNISSNPPKEPKTSSLNVATVNKSALYTLRPKADGEGNNLVNQRVFKTETRTSDVAFENLSSNVKRMISSVETTNNPLKLQKKSTSTVRVSSRRSNIPLVGATSKIAQSRVELLPTVEIYDQPCSLVAKKSEESPSKKLKPDFKLNLQETYDVPTNNKPVNVDNYTAFESLSLPYIDQSIEISNSSDREFDIKLSSTETTPQNPKTSNTEENPLQGAKIIPIKSNPVHKTSPAKQLLKSEPYPEAMGSTGNLKVDQETRLHPPTVEVSRPLSMSSIVSSSSSSSGVQNKGVNSAYLASIESLDDHSDDLTSANGSNNFVNDAGIVKVIYDDKKKDSLCDLEELPSLTQLERVCAEIVHTENVYVQHLQQVVEGYLHVWKRDMVFSEEELSELFNNIEDIYNFNRSLCAQLNTCELDATCIARCFVSNTGGFSVYTSYCTGYPRTMERLAALASRPQFRERQIALGHPLPLASYLLKPVQRILKYHLLLQNVVKQCASQETQYALLQMTDIAHHIDDMKRKHEHAVRVQEIQSLLYGWNGPDLTTYGELCAEGTFRVLGARGMRHAFLFDKMLLITKNREDGILAYKTHVMCNNMMLVESISGAALSFHVIPWDRPRALLTLQARSQRHKREWTHQLKRVILENYNAVIPSHARQLVMELGQNKTDDDILAEKSHNLITQASMRKQLSAPEYLEKRKLDRERRKSFENDNRRIKKPTRKYTLPLKNEQCDCAQLSVVKGIDYTCDSCYIDLCSDCEGELKDLSEKCTDCGGVLNESVENLDLKVDFKSSQDSFVKNKSGYSSDNLGVSLTNVHVKVCMKCARSKDIETSRSRRMEIGKGETLRSKSKDDPQRSKLSKIGTWRRKSEPNRQQVAIVAKRSQEKVVGTEKCEFLCRNCGSNKINRSYKHEEAVMSDPEIENRKRMKNNLEIKMYNTKNVPKKISKLKKNRAKAKFYADLSKDSFTDNVLHISESNDSLNVDATKQTENTNNLTIPNAIIKDDDIDEETYQKLIEKTDSFKKNELEKVKFLSKQKVIDENERIDEVDSKDEDVVESCEEIEQPLEHIISQLLMQNREFQKLLKKQQLRSTNHKRHAILLKSHSYPDQTPKSPTRKTSDAFIELGKDDEHFEEDHIYETLRVDRMDESLHSLDDKSIIIQHNKNVKHIRQPSPPKLKQKVSDATPKITDSDYVYLTFDKSLEEGIYDVPIKSPEKVAEKNQDYYVTMEKTKENIEDLYDNIVNVRNKKDDEANQGEYLPMSPEQKTGSPNTPEIWLSHQKEHFNVPRDRKSGSLPRSFQVNNPEDTSLTTFKTKIGKIYLNRDGKVMNTDRPYTIASDQGDIAYESVENYISEENIKFKKNKLIEANVQKISQSTLELEEEIDRCYKNNFEANLDTITTEKLNVSEPNLNVSATSSCEILPGRNENDEKEVIHPEHKIYKPTGNMLSLKNVLNRFKNRSQERHSDEAVENQVSDQSSPEVMKPDLKSPPNEKRSALNPRSYSKNLLQRFRSIIGDEHEEKADVQQKPKSFDDIENNIKSDIKVVITSSDVNSTSTSTNYVLSKSVYEQTTLTESQTEKNNLETLSHSCDNINKKEIAAPKYERSASVASALLNPKNNTSYQSLNKLPIYMQGSKHLGARIAQSDYADPKTLNDKPGVKAINILINKNSIRPDSLLSNTSYATNSSDGFETIKPTDDVKETITVQSDESFYEKSFEKIENVIDDDVFRDSAVYSDQEEDLKSDKNTKRNLAVLVVKRNASFKSEHTIKTRTVSETSTNSQTRITLTSKVNEVKPQFNDLKQKTAPPIAAKPKLTHLPTTSSFQTRVGSKTFTKTDNSNDNTNFKRNITLKYVRTESVDSKNVIETSKKMQEIKSTQTFKRLTTDRASLDSATRKTKPNVETTKSVLERRLELESLSKSVKPKPAYPLTKKPSQLVKPKTITSKITPYERKSADFGKVTDEVPSTSKPHIPTNDLVDKIDADSKGSWVKTVVNKFQ